METTPKCLHCEADLAGAIEQAIGELVLRCREELQDAVIRNVEAIGEAAKRVSAVRAAV